MDCNSKLSLQVNFFIPRANFFFDKNFPPCLRPSNPLPNLLFLLYYKLWCMVPECPNQKSFIISNSLQTAVEATVLISLQYIQPNYYCLVKAVLNYWRGLLTSASSFIYILRNPELILLKYTSYHVIPMLETFQWLTIAFRTKGLD